MYYYESESLVVHTAEFWELNKQNSIGLSLNYIKNGFYATRRSVSLMGNRAVSQLSVIRSTGKLCFSSMDD